MSDIIRCTAGIPQGYKSILWREVEAGDRVWVAGTHQGKPFAYGPFKVHSVYERELVNIKGRVFMHYPQDLLVKENS